MERKFWYDFVVRTVVWLLLDQFCDLFFCSSHGTSAVILAQLRNQDHKEAQETQIKCASCAFLWLTSVPFCGLFRSFSIVRLRGLIGVPWRRPVIFAVIGNDLHRLLRRSLILVFSLRKCSGRNNAQHRYDHELSYQSNHFQPILLMQFRAWKGEREMRRPEGQQYRCHVL